MPTEESLQVDEPNSRLVQGGAPAALGLTDGVGGNVIRWGWYSVAVNLALIALHGLVATASGSLAVTAELLHNFVDLASSAMVVVGLKFAMRKNRAFPYGLYKVENLVAAALAIMIFFTAFEVISSVFINSHQSPSVDTWMLLTLIVTMTIPLVFSRFELRAARLANSPALKADALEYRVHVYTTGLAFAALLTAWFDLPLDRIAALIIVIAVAKTGWDLLADAMRVLLDASLDPKIIGEIEHVIRADPAVVELTWITGRNAGRFRFVEAGVSLRPTDLAQAEIALARVESSVRAAMPQIERVLLHAEPRLSAVVHCAIPLADRSGTISEHFGEAPYFAFVRAHRADGAIEDQRIDVNPYRNEERAKGLRVAEWLVGEKVDRVVVPKPLDGKGPAYVFSQAGIEMTCSDARTVADLFAHGVKPKGLRT